MEKEKILNGFTKHDFTIILEHKNLAPLYDYVCSLPGDHPLFTAYVQRFWNQVGDDDVETAMYNISNLIIKVVNENETLAVTDPEKFINNHMLPALNEIPILAPVQFREWLEDHHGWKTMR